MKQLTLALLTLAAGCVPSGTLFTPKPNHPAVLETLSAPLPSVDTLHDAHRLAPAETEREGKKEHQHHGGHAS